MADKMSMPAATEIPFCKMQGLGNDFVIIDDRQGQWSKPLAQTHVVQRIADRHFGIGCDQLVVLRPPDEKVTADVKMVILNNDGSAAETCGNATRCVAQFLANEGKEKQQGKAGQPLKITTHFAIQSHQRVLSADILPNGMVRVTMGGGVHESDKIPLSQNCDTANLPLKKLLQDHALSPMAPPMAINVGNPHCILLVANADQTDIEKIGRAIEHHPLFPQRTNVEFLSPTPDTTRFRLRVWERGAGATLACGSGAVAAFLALVRMGRVTADGGITMAMDGGELLLTGRGSGRSPVVDMTGPAEFVFSGVVRVGQVRKL